jgi:microcystin degradation protein MlrC
VLDVGGIAVVVTTHCGPAQRRRSSPRTASTWRPRGCCAVRAKNHFRAAFAERCAAIFDVDCPGPAMADVEKLRRSCDREETRCARRQAQ